MTNSNLVGTDFTSLEVKFKRSGSSMFKTNAFWRGDERMLRRSHYMVTLQQFPRTPPWAHKSTVQTVQDDTRPIRGWILKFRLKMSGLSCFHFFIYNITYSDLIIKKLAREKDRQLCFVTLSLRHGSHVWSLCRRDFHYLVNGLLPKFAAHLVIVHSKRCVFLFTL